MRFINEIKARIKAILSKEIGCKVSGNRFYDARQETSYPIKVVIYNNKSILGYFNPDFYELGFHECLMHTSKEQLENVIKHELAHYITWIKYGASILPHGVEFRAFCQKLGWSEEVYSATICLEESVKASDEESSVCRKVKKLMALASSSNRHEAELAMIKSQQLLLKHNMEFTHIADEDDEPVFLRRVLKQKRENAKMRSIARILETFFVACVYNRSDEYIYLEILGSAANVEVADYVACVLQVEMDGLWSTAQKEANLRGAVAKNSFFLGLARGYCDKIQALKKEYTRDESTALMVIEKQLKCAKSMAYTHLSKSYSSGRHSAQASSLGEQMGRKLTINPAISNAKSAFQGLLSIFR